MNARFPIAALFFLLVGGCGGQAPQAAAVASGPAVAPAEPAPHPAAPVRMGTVGPRAANTGTNAGRATLSGYGDMRLGSSVADARQAWAGALDGSPGEPGGCHYLSPGRVGDTNREPAFMIERDRFVRYDVGTAAVTAPGGGRVGMSVAELTALYGSLESLAHKYVEGGRYLSPARTGVAPTRLVFETDASDRITAWRVGMEPQVDYVEGCS